MKPPVDADSPEGPGLPGLRNWRAVYFFVLGSFALWVALLVALTMVSS
jgi:hypothetical protein